MSASRTIAILTVVALPLLLAGYMTGKAAPAPDSHRRMKASLEALQKKLPTSLAEVLKKALKWGDPKNEQMRAKVELARITGPSEGRIILSIPWEPVEGLTYTFYYIAYLHYFDGQWTTTRIEPPFEKRKREPCSPTIPDPPLMLAIDQAGEK
jgi:hypothetical protein